MSDEKQNDAHVETIAIHAGLAPDGSTGAISQPIQLATTFERDIDGSYTRNFHYAREGNPNRQALEICLARLEGGADAAAFSSGSAATLALFQSVGPGNHIVASIDAYYGTNVQLAQLVRPLGIEVSFVDTTDAGNVADNLRPETRLIWVETPSNPLLKVSDISALKTLAEKHGTLLAFDNTFATPVLQNPLKLGADLVVHSATKYLGGHGDLTGGAVITRKKDEVFAAIRQYQTAGGSVPSPFDCWLLRRSIATLPYRIRAQSDNAQALAEHLSDMREVVRVYYPGLPDHPGHQTARKQMTGYGGVLSFEVDGDESVAMAVAARTTLIKRATSLGGVESLIEHRASMEDAATRCPRNLLRMSVGIEHSDDLLADLTQALTLAV